MMIGKLFPKASWFAVFAVAAILTCAFPSPARAHEQNSQVFDDTYLPEIWLLTWSVNFPSGDQPVLMPSLYTVNSTHTMSLSIYQGSPQLQGYHQIFVGDYTVASSRWEMNSDQLGDFKELSAEVNLTGETTVRANSHVTSPFYAINDTHTLFQMQ